MQIKKGVATILLLLRIGWISICLVDYNIEELSMYLSNLHQIITI